MAKFAVAAVVGVDSTLHQVLIADDKTATVQSFNNGCMQIWQISIAPDRTHYLTGYFFETQHSFMA